MLTLLNRKEVPLDSNFQSPPPSPHDTIPAEETTHRPLTIHLKLISVHSLRVGTPLAKILCARSGNNNAFSRRASSTISDAFFLADIVVAENERIPAKRNNQQ